MRCPIALLAISALAQRLDEPIVQITVDLVQVDAIVTDRARRIVRGLGIDDFEVLQDGKPVKLDAVSFIDLAPPGASALALPMGQKPRSDEVRRSMAIVVDDLNLSHRSLVSTRLGLKKFVEAGIAPGTLVSIMRTGGGAGTLQSFTTDKRQLLATIDNMNWRPSVWAASEIDSPHSAALNSDAFGLTGSRPRVLAEGPQPRCDIYGCDDTARDAPSIGSGGPTTTARALGAATAIEWAFEGMRAMPGRKSIIVVSDGIDLSCARPRGMDTPERRRFQQLASDAHRAGVVFYSVDARGLRVARPRVRDENVLAYLTAQTGGRFLRERSFLENDLAEIAEEQSGYYLIGYRPPEGTFDWKYHKIEVRTKRAGLAVRSRRELLGQQTAPFRARAGEGRELARALSSPFHSDGIPLRLTALHMVNANGKQVVRCLLHIDAKPVRRVEAGGALRAELDVVAAGVDTEGILTASNASRYEARVQPAKVADLERAGLLYGVEYAVAKPGPYQIRVAVRDRFSGLLGSASQFIEIPDRSRGRIALSSMLLDRMRSGGAQAAEVDPFGNPAVRRYRAGDRLAYALQLYNAGKAQRLTSQLRLHRDGEVVFEGPLDPLTLRAGTDPAVAPLEGVLSLDESLPAGNYVAELRVSDGAGRKPVTVSQWIEFTVE